MGPCAVFNMTYLSICWKVLLKYFWKGVSLSILSPLQSIHWTNRFSSKQGNLYVHPKCTCFFKKALWPHHHLLVQIKRLTIKFQGLPSLEQNSKIGITVHFQYISRSLLLFPSYVTAASAFFWDISYWHFWLRLTVTEGKGTSQITSHGVCV